MSIKVPPTEETRWLDRHGPPPGMEAKRTADAKLRQEQAKAAVPEAIEYADGISFIVSRCVRGPQGWVGLFSVDQVVFEDAQRKPLKKPLRKRIAEGVDMVVAMSSMETAARKRYFR